MAKVEQKGLPKQYKENATKWYFRPVASLTSNKREIRAFVSLW